MSVHRIQAYDRRLRSKMSRSRGCGLPPRFIPGTATRIVGEQSESLSFAGAVLSSSDW